MPRPDFSPAPDSEASFSRATPQDRLEVYAVALDLHAVCMALPLCRGSGPLRDQLHRASLSVVLNIAEGAGRNARTDKRRFYEIAKGSAAESAAVLDVARLRRLAPEAALREARGLALRASQMLSRLAGPLR